jgi:hypothetical protein
MMPHAAALSLAVVFIATACSPGPMPVSQSPRDPSNPAAAEGVTAAVPPPAPVASAAEGSHGSHSGDHGSGRGAGSVGGAQGVEAGDAGVSSGYVCPMHPEVTSPAPGRCSKCGMNLVPKK